MLKSVKKEGKIVSPKMAKLKKTSVLLDPMGKFISNFFDKELKGEFAKFLQEKAKVIPIDSAKKKDKVYKKEGKEPISFRELTSFKNPLFSMGTSFLPEEYNPDTVDISTYDLMRRDHQLAAGLAVIKLPIVSLTWTVHCDDMKIAKTVEWALKRVWSKLIKSILMAVDYGFSCNEKVWERSDVKISNIDKEGKEDIYFNGDLAYWKKIKPNHPSSIKMKFDGNQNLEEIIQERETGGDIHLPTRKVFLFTNEEEFGNPFGASRLKNAYKVWYWKELLYQFMMQYYERRGTPPAIATAPPGKSRDSSNAEVDNLELGLRLASSLISSSVGVIPYQESKSGRENMWKLELLNDDARGPMFVEAMRHLDARCLRAIYVPENIVTQEGGGGYSSVSVHADLFLMSEKGLISDIEDAVNSQLIRPFIEANFPPNKRRPAYIKLDPLDWNRKIALKEIFVEMLRNVDTMIQSGIAPTIIPSLEKMAAILEIPVETWKDYTGSEDIPVPETSNPDNPEDPNKSTRKKTRRESTNQTQDRRRINPGGKRADRLRKSDTTTKR